MNRTKKYLLVKLLLLSSAIAGLAQQKQAGVNQDGIYISYEVSKIAEYKDTDTYMVVTRAENKNDYDIRYSNPYKKQFNGILGVNMLLENGFAQTTVRNAKGRSSRHLILKGMQCALLTKNGQPVYIIPAGGTIRASQEVTLKKGMQPVIISSFFQRLKNAEVSYLADQ